jgi:hypothetical protein
MAAAGFSQCGMVLPCEHDGLAKVNMPAAAACANHGNILDST